MKKSRLISLLVILLLIPATIYLCARQGGRVYYLASLLIIIYTMIPFFMAFEHRKPQARELVLLAVMSALAVAARTAFIAVPNFKPITAIIMITGIALGAEAGFLTGAVSAFASNFIFGQGPWTPWQMVAYGLAGFIAGILFRKLNREKRLPLAIVGFLLVLLVIGPLLDTCAVFTMSSVVDKSSVLAVYAAGIPVNVVHGAATFLTLLLFAKPLLEKLDRVKIKYGLMEE